MLHAYFLHTRPYRETSLLVDVFTAEKGRLGVVWKGARRAKSGIPQLFQPLLLEVTGSAELKTLSQVEPAGPALSLVGNALFSAFYLNEILVRLLPREEDHSSLFLSYALTLGHLSESASPAPLLRAFESELLDLLGYGIDFLQDDQGLPIEQDVFYDYHPERGFTRVPISRALAKGKSILALASGSPMDTEVARLAKRINRMALGRLLGSRPLKSRELFLGEKT